MRRLLLLSFLGVLLVCGSVYAKVNMVTVCHIPENDPTNPQTMVVSEKKVSTHLAHGDTLGACPEDCDELVLGVRQTGQTGCWDLSGNAIGCGGTGQDGEYQAGVSVDPRFTADGNGTVTDNLTGLIWLQNANCYGIRTWTQAFSDANTLADGSCGLTDGSVAGDWRLPNVNELQSLIDYGQSNPVLPPGHPFSGVQAAVPGSLTARYWSSTTHPTFRHYALYVGFNFGYVGLEVKNLNGNLTYVWPVRGGQ